MEKRIATLVLLASMPAFAQEPPVASPRIEDLSRVRPATFNETFEDSGNRAAKELAAFEGISVGEATRRLRHMHNAGRIMRMLQKSDPDTFAGVFIDESGKLVALFAGAGSSETRRTKLKNAGVEADVLSGVEIREVKHSLTELRRRVQELDQQGKAAGLKFDVALDRKANALRILTPDPTQVRAAIDSGALKVSEDVEIEKSEPIVLTADINGGKAFNNSNTFPYGCTTGFVVIRTSDQRRGVTTAGHCDPQNAGGTTKEYNPTLGSKPGATGRIPLTTMKVWTTGNKDVAWYTHASGAHVYPPVWWDGAGYPAVKGAKWSVPGDFVCKFGRRTFKTCGYVASYEVYSSPYGYFSAVPANATYSQMNEVGDSGGPVWFSTNTAVGTVHAKRGSEMLFSEIGRLDYDGTGISVLVTY